ncbi:MAG: cell surface protein SprA [Proteiniphilum sp.]|nr:cell surface protein SprA [Proteiniphilum sp.]
MAVVSLRKSFFSFLFLLLFCLNGTGPLNAQRPSIGVRTVVRYDPGSGLYIFEKKIGEHLLETPMVMTQKEYMAYRLRKLQSTTFRELEKESVENSTAPYRLFTLTGLRKESQSPTPLFGAGGVELTTQGSVEISAGIKRDLTDNPTLPLRARKRSFFHFDQQIQLNLNAKMGDRIDFNLNYDTEATFDFNNKEIKLDYRGEEDEIIRNIQAGNVRMTTSNPLIDGGTDLFGIKADLQFGKLQVNTLFSRQLSETHTHNGKSNGKITSFDFGADNYDENRHFFLAHWFRDNYDRAMSTLPYVGSPVSITRIEVWVTNRQGDYSQVRNIIALSDLGEHTAIHNPRWQPAGTEETPHNRSNTLYDELITTYASMRHIHQGVHPFPADVVDGTDYEQLENARLLSPSEYSFQPQLGYISLAMPLQPDEVLAVAFEYNYGGDVYQVGEFSSDIGSDHEAASNGEDALFTKLLKPVSLSPASPSWDLMMKNIYSLGYDAYNLSPDHFRLELTYQHDSTGVYLSYLPGSGIEEELLLRVMQLDRLNERKDPYPDGQFDFLEGYTIDTRNGKVIFPVTEPFGSHLEKKIGNESLAAKFLFQELYDSTRTAARQIAEKNKFRISGEYRATSDGVISLNTMNLARGSVKVTAGGITLTEGVDYTVDYLSGSITILNRSLLDADTPVSVTLEERSLSQKQRKMLTGVNLQYDFSKELSLGATLMHYTEKPLTVKTAIGEEATKNMLWGSNLSWKKESALLTSLLDLLPFTDASAPSQLTTELAFARMIPGHYSNRYTKGEAYIDDFESAASTIDLHAPYAWSLAATPTDNSPAGLFPEGALTNNIATGKNRALLSWYYIDGIFTRKNATLTPSHIRNDPDQLSDHRVREIYEQEIFPERDILYGQPTTLPVLNLSYYPRERGPYNLDTEVDSDGFLLNPQRRWGGITRSMDIRDFEAANVEYIEFWLMDPFVYDAPGSSPGGDLYFHLGEISEDLLRDGKKFFENGLPAERDSSIVGESIWGLYPKQQSTVYGFDNSLGEEVRRLQDVGLNGLSSEEEKSFPTYRNYLEELQKRLSEETLSRMREEAHSPLNDPAGDLFRHYRGEEQDRRQLSILERYKYYNGTEGNSLPPGNDDPYHSASRNTPDHEDIDRDNTLNTKEAYYSYRVSLRRDEMVAGSNYITDKREVTVTLRNGGHENVTWYLFRIPLSDFHSKSGNIQGFHNIRFMRMLLTGFEKPLFLRFATLGLVRSEWRTYRDDPASGGTQTGSGQLSISAVNIEENGNRTPVNYVLPPGVTRIIDPSQPQLRQENEQALSLRVEQLEAGESKAIYKSVLHDLRRYKRLQMFVHAEQLTGETGTLQDGDLSLFLRIGSDYRHNYYEVEVPLSLTPEGRYSTHVNADRERVWPQENRIDLSLKQLTQLKMKRNALMRETEGSGLYKAFTEADPDRPDNRISIMGNPSLAEVKVMMIGIRNNSSTSRSGEVWVNELRLDDYDEKGGWAAEGNVGLTLSDIGTIRLSGKMETTGFGAINQGLQERRNNDLRSVNLALNLELGRFLPRKAKITAPLSYFFSNNRESPLYDPFNSDLLLSETLKQLPSGAGRDSLRQITTTESLHQSFSLANLKMNIRSAQPMPYDPANFSFSYTDNQLQERNPAIEYAMERDQRLQALYSYSPGGRPWEAFGLHLRYLPDQINLSHNLHRHYRERQLRDLNAYASGFTESQPAYLSFSHNFYWDRQLSFTWNFSPNLNLSFRSGTLSEIEEPYLQVNKALNRSDYEIWKDSVTHSLRGLGSPLRYNQSADVHYTLPFNRIPVTDWISSSAVYHSQYRWERGATIEDKEIGNYLQNELSFALNSRFNLSGLYRKFPSIKIPLALSQAMMMIRQINLNITYKRRTDLPGYKPMSGDLFGQTTVEEKLLPGLPFAFGADGGRTFVEEALANNHLVINQENIAPAIFNRTKHIKMDASLEPFPGIRVNLHALYEENRRSEYRFMYGEIPEIQGGSFAISIISLFSAFERNKAGRQYHSTSFGRFMEYRAVIAGRVRDQYAGSLYPQEGFLNGSTLAGEAFSGNSGDVKPNSADVLIPAFLAAYTGKSAEKIALTPFPALSTMLPNWDLSVSLTTLMPALQQPFSELMLTHRYLAQYRIGSYNTHLSWVPAGQQTALGFIRDVITGAPEPSSPYDIRSATITESFNPLFELRASFHNQLHCNIRLNRTRSLNLNISSYQIMEMRENDLVIGGGYRIPDFGRLANITTGTGVPHRRSASQQHKRKNEAVKDDGAFRNDLTLRFDLSLKKTEALIRRMTEGNSQPTSGIQTGSLRFSADYAVSRQLTLRAFYDRMVRKPLVSSFAPPTASNSAGISLRIHFR